MKMHSKNKYFKCAFFSLVFFPGLGSVQIEKEDASEIMRHVGSAFSLVRPKGGESNSGAPSPLNTILPPSGVDDTTNASPLQRMASITNSLISQVHVFPHYLLLLDDLILGLEFF